MMVGSGPAFRVLQNPLRFVRFLTLPSGPEIPLHSSQSVVRMRALSVRCC